MKIIRIITGLFIVLTLNEANAATCVYVPTGSTNQYTGTVNASGACCYHGSCAANNRNVVTTPSGAIDHTSRAGGVNGVQNNSRHHSAGRSAGGRRGR